MDLYIIYLSNYLVPNLRRHQRKYLPTNLMRHMMACTCQLDISTLSTWKCAPGPGEPGVTALGDIIQVMRTIANVLPMKIQGILGGVESGWRKFGR